MTTDHRQQVRDLVDHVEHFQARVIQDALNEATAAYWLNRAVSFEWVIHGGPIPTTHAKVLSRRPLKPRAEWTHIDHQAAATAAACRHRAAVSLIPCEPSREVWDALHEPAPNHLDEHPAQRHATHPTHREGIAS
ncbi:MAG: hypothetical protein ACRCYU_17890 [Nocardioides sp.]